MRKMSAFVIHPIHAKSVSMNSHLITLARRKKNLFTTEPWKNSYFSCLSMSVYQECKDVRFVGSNQTNQNILSTFVILINSCSLITMPSHASAQHLRYTFCSRSSVSINENMMRWRVRTSHFVSHIPFVWREIEMNFLNHSNWITIELQL